ncbi:hypothetical protein BH753_gp077 [Bacillus phage Shbh1]|uniref:Uncharacterized protein n=1 Tax=Bacillus phage Shbh1 TaxID=1796992 RepID=A0A142F1A2_9CAUD|nr:hypothetical protein BH753_gp077 [Bacillus phage Shbh1]AMQ66559.1 hypothetical protein [Bacillus phage Shbh1]
MSKLTMDDLEMFFNRAKEENRKFVAIKVLMEGFPKEEVIVNPVVNVDTKLAYYKKTYDRNLNHKFAEGIKIIGFCHANSLSDIEDILYVGK